MRSRRSDWLRRLPALFEIPAPDGERARARIILMERTLMLPVRLIFMAIIFFSFNHTPWVGQVSSALDVTVETVQLIFWFYVFSSTALTLPLFAIERLPLAVVQWLVFTSAMIDGLLLASMALLTGGTDSILFWLFIGLILRNSVSVPPGFSQLTLNFLTSMCYALVVVMDIAISANMDDTMSHALDLTPRDTSSEPVILRLLVLWFTAISSYGVQAFLEKQRQITEESAEFAARENQLRSAGRLAAEFAHQIKNPLAVVKNAAYSLNRSIQARKLESAGQQIEIIQEEVARADRVITQIMGYAQLSEGRVEKLDVAKKINDAINQVFPPAVPVEIRIEKDLRGPFPPLLMQRGHISEILVNLLQNAREALGGHHGTIRIAALARPDHTIEISVEDDGPGVPPDKIERIFEAYYTTKENGSGLGLAIVKHNAELYGGSVRLDSALGKGARFTVIFPAKTVPKPFAK